MKITAKLILNVAHHDWATKKVFNPRLPKTALYNLFVLLQSIRLASCIKRLLENVNCIEEL